MKQSAQDVRLASEILSLQIKSRGQVAREDIAFYTITYPNEPSLVEMRRQLWAKELLVLNAASEKLHEGEGP